jgi:hypothetical protein
MPQLLIEICAFAAGRQADMLLGTRLDSLDLATEGKSLRIKAWQSRVRDSGSSMHLQNKRASESSEPSPDSTATAMSVLPKTRPIASQGSPAADSLSPHDRYLLDQLLGSPQRPRAAEAGRTLPAMQQPPGRHSVAYDETTSGFDGRQPSLSSMSTTSSRLQSFRSGRAAARPGSASVMPPAAGFVQAGMAGSPAWQQRLATPQGFQHPSIGAAISAGPPIRWVEISSSATAGAESSADMLGRARAMDDVDISSPRSNISWQPLSDLGKNDDLFCTSLMSTEQDLGDLRNHLAQVLPQENLSRAGAGGGLEHVTEEHSDSLHEHLPSRSLTTTQESLLTDDGALEQQRLRQQMPPFSLTGTQQTFGDRLIITHGDAFR